MPNKCSFHRLLIAAFAFTFGTGASCLGKDAEPHSSVDAAVGGSRAPGSTGGTDAVAGAGRSASPLDAGRQDASLPYIGPSDAGRFDASTGVDAAMHQDAASKQLDATAAQDGGAAPEPYDPGPAVQVVVNSGNTAQLSVWDGKWQRFYFDATVSQVYAISSLSGIVRGYVSTSPEVSSSNYQFVTDADGDLSLIASAIRYYIAVVAIGGGVSGSFQVADGGQLIALGSTSLTLNAPHGDDNWFFHFPVTAGHSYQIRVEGPIQPNVGLAVAPRPERTSNGQLAWSIWGLGGSLPFDELIPAASVANSKSGFYYFYVNVKTTMNLTIALTPGS